MLLFLLPLLTPVWARSATPLSLVAEQRVHQRRQPFAQPGFGTADALVFLSKYGYMSTSTRKEDKGDMAGALSAFQSFAGLEETGRLDDATAAQMQRPRCGVPDFRVAKSLQRRLAKLHGRQVRRRTRRYAVGEHRDRLSGPEVTYRISKYSTSTMPGASKAWQDLTMARAFALWEAVIPLRFRRLDSGPVDVDIAFFDRFFHGDDQLFDGNGGTLAHAFFPDEGGDVHFDDDEPWGPGGRNLLWVAAHELGHSLGLRHSRRPDALMNSEYGGQGLGDRVRLSQDDIDGIQTLYGARSGPAPRRSFASAPVMTTTTAPPTTTPQRWRPNFFPKRRPYQPWKPYRKPQASYRPPKKSWRDSWRKTRFSYQTRRPRTTSTTTTTTTSTTTTTEAPWVASAPAADICRDASLDAAFTLSNGTAVAVKGAHYWLLDLRMGRPLPGYPRSLEADWRIRLGSGRKVTAAANSIFGLVHIFVGSEAYTLDERDVSGAGGSGALGPVPVYRLQSYNSAPASGLDAAMLISDGGPDRAFFFQGPKYWRDGDLDGAKDERWARNLYEISPGLFGRSVDAAVFDRSRGSALLFSGAQYWRAEESRWNLKSESRRGSSTAVDLFGCSSPSEASRSFFSNSRRRLAPFGRRRKTRRT